MLQGLVLAFDSGAPAGASRLETPKVGSYQRRLPDASVMASDSGAPAGASGPGDAGGGQLPAARGAHAPAGRAVQLPPARLAVCSFYDLVRVGTLKLYSL